MKRIIKGKLYDTDTARLVASCEYDILDNLNGWSEDLYCKRTGEYFLVGSGGANTKYAHRAENNNWRSGEKLIPLSYENAKTWAESHMSTHEYEVEFGPIIDDNSRTVLSISLPTATADKARKMAKERSVSISALISDLINNL